MAGRIVQTDVERVRAASDLAAIAGERVALKRQGRRLVARCPFHDEKTPSFSINPEMGLYHCFGCGVSGDVISFVQEIESLDFRTAVERLAGRAGVQLHYEGESAADRTRRMHRPRLQDCLAAAVVFYRDALRRGSDGGAARRYLTSRSIDRDVAACFELGWAPDEWDACCRHLRSKGFRDEELRESGVAVTSSRGTLIDQLRARVVFPIFDPQGAPVALAGRTLLADEKPKYKNSPETDLYKKSRTLYGLNWARADVVARGEVVVVEGYTDVIGFHQAGAPNTVATCGTALAEEHLQLLKRFTTRLVLAFDADAAGEMATERVFDMTAKLGLDVWVAALPAGRDPADVAADGPDAVAKVLDLRRPLLEFKLDRELERADLTSAAGEARAIDLAAEIIARHPDTQVRYAAARGLTRRLRDVDETAVSRRVEQFRRSDSPERRDAGSGARPENAAKLTKVEGVALAMLLQRPAAFLDTAPDVEPSWFSSAAAGALAGAFLAVAASKPPAPGDPLRIDRDRDVPAEVAGLVGRLAAFDPEGFVDPAAAARDAAQALRRNWVHRRIGELQHAMDAAETSGDTETVRRLDAELVPFIERRQALGGT